jgi:hypothetical protein
VRHGSSESTRLLQSNTSWAQTGAKPELALAVVQRLTPSIPLHIVLREPFWRALHRRRSSTYYQASTRMHH